MHLHVPGRKVPQAPSIAAALYDAGDVTVNRGGREGDRTPQSPPSVDFRAGDLLIVITSDAEYIHLPHPGTLIDTYRA